MILLQSRVPSPTPSRQRDQLGKFCDFGSPPTVRTDGWLWGKRNPKISCLEPNRYSAGSDKWKVERDRRRVTPLSAKVSLGLNGISGNGQKGLWAIPVSSCILHFASDANQISLGYHSNASSDPLSLPMPLPLNGLWKNLSQKEESMGKDLLKSKIILSWIFMACLRLRILWAFLYLN
ncbi:hypothetical protein SUGI_0195690 [Cryptomeria japonica]|nr:hypothetical protein SUGI_0195690 [Cryptomeria japonica]